VYFFLPEMVILKVVNIVQEDEKYLPFCKSRLVASKGASRFPQGEDTAFGDCWLWGC